MEPQKMDPAARGGANRVNDLSGSHRGKPTETETQSLAAKRAADRRKLVIRARILPDGETHTLNGRQAWALLELHRAGQHGCTPIDTPGPRWSGYVFKLRQAGFSVETINEEHGGAFSGWHARYVLRNKIQIEDLSR